MGRSADVGDRAMVAGLRRTHPLQHIAARVLVLPAVAGLVGFGGGKVPATPVSPNRQLSTPTGQPCYASLDRGASETPAASGWIELYEETEEEEERLREQHSSTESHRRGVAANASAVGVRRAVHLMVPPGCVNLKSVVLRL